MGIVLRLIFTPLDDRKRTLGNVRSLHFDQSPFGSRWAEKRRRVGQRQYVSRASENVLQSIESTMTTTLSVISNVLGTWLLMRYFKTS